MPTTRQYIAVAAACTTVTALLMLPGLLSGPNFDASVFLLIGDRLLEGDLPYVDLWDHKPPGIYLMDAALVLTLGWAVGPWPAVWIGSVAATAGIGMAVVGASSRTWGVWPSAAAGILAAAFAASWPFALGGGLTETFAAASLALAAWAAVAGRSAGAWAAVGMLVAFAVAISLLAAPAAVALLVLLAVRASVRATLIALGSAVAVGTVGIGVAAALGMLPAMIDALVTYNGAYRASSVADPLPESLAISPRLVVWYLLNGAVIIGPAALGVLATRRHAFAAACLIALLATIGLIGIGGRLYGHYLVLVAPFLGLLAAGGLGIAQGWAATPARRVVAIAGVGLLACVSGGAGWAATLSSAPDAYSLRNRDRAAAAELRERVSGPGSVLVWGNAPMVYQLSGIDAAWRYVYLLPLLTPGYVTDERVASLVTDLRDAPPCWVVDAGSPEPGQAGLPPLLEDRPLTPSERRVDLLDPVRSFVGERYMEVARVDGWPVYELESGCS